MISALAWVPRGAAKPVQDEQSPTEAELAALKEGGEVQPDEADGLESEGSGSDSDVEMDQASEVAQARAMAAAVKAKPAANKDADVDLADPLAELHMEDYDTDEEGEEMKTETASRLFGSGNPGLSYYQSNQQDPNISKHGGEDDSEADDFEVHASDFVILAARNEDEVSHIEVWIYEDAGTSEDSNIYVHHDIMLPAFPLSLAWMDCRPTGDAQSGNLAAVGTMSPGIEIWDLDDVGAVEPVATLGGELPEGALTNEDKKKQKKKKQKKQKKKKALKPDSHADAVLALSWNRDYRNVLASGSADTTVKVWDLATEQCSATLDYHQDKVQAVAWNPAQASVLLSGGFDKAVCLADARTPNSEPLKWALSADSEALTWAPHEPTTFLASSEDGLVACYDARKGAGSAPLYRLSAHDRPACALTFCTAVPGLLATASTDKQVKLWDVSTQQPALIAMQDLQVGAVFGAAFCPEAPWLLAAGGAMGTVAVWDITTNSAVMSKYGRKLSRAVAAAAGDVSTAAEQ